MKSKRMCAAVLTIMMAGIQVNALAETVNDEKGIAQIVAGNNELGNVIMSELLREELEEESERDNIFISPYSIATALSVLANCSEEGEHIEELKTFLGYGNLTDEELMESQVLLMDELIPSKKEWAKDYSEEELAELGMAFVEFANAVYLDDDQIPCAAFDSLAEILNVYQAEVEIKELASEKTKEEINAWVKEKTHGLIESLLDEPLDPSMAVFLINSVYFKGAWSNMFMEHLTDTQIFYGLDYESEIQMMHQQEFFAYAETDKYQVITLPYNYGYEMNIYLPKDVEECMNWGEEGYIETLLSEEYDFEQTEIILSLPKFELEYDTNLEDILKALGVEKIFEMNRYDRLCEDVISVDEILHKTALKVDENGTEAAAITAIMTECAMVTESEPVEMTIDKPFYFTITNRKSNLNLFEGCVMNLGEAE